MASYHVVPDGNTWTVKTEKGSIVSKNHRKKQPAIDEMNRAASPGDSKYVHDSNGQIMYERTHRG